MPELLINTDLVCDLCEVLRERAGLAANRGSLVTDGDNSALAGLIEHSDDPRVQEINAVLDGLNDDERASLMALILVGREDFSLGEWPDALTLARDRLAKGAPGYLAEFLVGDPASPEFLSHALELFGRACPDGF